MRAQTHTCIANSTARPVHHGHVLKPNFCSPTVQLFFLHTPMGRWASDYIQILEASSSEWRTGNASARRNIINDLLVRLREAQQADAKKKPLPTDDAELNKVCAFLHTILQVAETCSR